METPLPTQWPKEKREMAPPHPNPLPHFVAEREKNLRFALQSRLIQRLVLPGPLLHFVEEREKKAKGAAEPPR